MLTTATTAMSSSNNMTSMNDGGDQGNSAASFPNNGGRISTTTGGGVDEQEQQQEPENQQQQYQQQDGEGVDDSNSGGPVNSDNKTTPKRTASGSVGFGSTPPRGGDWKSPIMTHFGGERKKKQSTVTTTRQTPNNDDEKREEQHVDEDGVSTTTTSLSTTYPDAVTQGPATTDTNDSAIEAEAPSSQDAKCPTLPPEKAEATTPPSSTSSSSAFPFTLSVSDESMDHTAASTTTPTATSKRTIAPHSASALSSEHPTGAATATAIAHITCDTSTSTPRRRERSDSLKLHELETPTVAATRTASSSLSNLELLSLSTEAAQQIATHFAAEHKVFLKAALALLTERDRHAPTVGMMDPVVLKAGPLKKASHLMNGVWKVKYVEIRRGMFSYYENVAKEGTPGQLRRKNIPLDAGHFGANSGVGNSGGGGGATGMSGSDHNRGSGGGGGGDGGNSSGNDHHAPCTCRAVRLHQKAFLKLTIPGQAGAMFELSVHGQKRLWMANSRAERAVWMQAIENAMVGGSVTGYSATSSAGGEVFDHRGKIRHVSPRSPFRSDLRLYLRLQSYLRSIHTKAEYVDGLREVLNHPIKVPVKWIAKQALLSDQAEGNNAFLEQEVNLSVEQLWRDLQRDSVCIDGKVYRGDHPTQGPERILGALMRRILQTAAASATTARTDWTQAQALSFARDILLSGNRTRSGGDSYFCINSLFKHPELVVVVPSGTEVDPVSITVSQDESDLPLNPKSGWIQTRSSKLQRTWKKFFFVLSEGMLTHYERAAPRPHGLRGQLAMADASISVSRRNRPNSSTAADAYFVISIVAKDGKERLLRFENEDRILDWTHALETMARAKNSKNVATNASNASDPTVAAPSSTPAPASAARRLMPRRRTGNSSQDDANSNQNNNNNNASTSAASTTPLASTTPGPAATSNLAEQIMETHGRNLGISLDKVKDRLALRSRKTSSAVRVFIQAVTDYKICTTDPDGDEQLDTWGYVRTQFQQNFRLSGGPSGFISRGEEIVLVTVIDCVDLGAHAGEETQQTSQQQHSGVPPSPDDIPPSPARRQPRKSRMFRQFIDDLGAEDA